MGTSDNFEGDANIRLVANVASLSSSARESGPDGSDESVNGARTDGRPPILDLDEQEAQGVITREVPALADEGAPSGLSAASAPPSAPPSAPMSPASQKAVIGNEGLHFLAPEPAEPNLSNLSNLSTRSNPWPRIPTPTRTAQRSRQLARPHAASSSASQRRPASRGSYVPRLPMSSATRNGRMASAAVTNSFTNAVPELSLSPPRWRVSQSAQEYLAAALHIAQLQAGADHAIGTEAYGRRKQQTEDAVQEAEMELTTVCFLLGDKDAEAAEDLLELEAQRQPVLIAQRLRARLDELRARTEHSRLGVFR